VKRQSGPVVAGLALAGLALAGLALAGLALRWRELRAIRSDGKRAEGTPISFGMWVVADPDAAVGRATRAGSDDGAASVPYFGLVWPAAKSLVAKILTGPRLDGARVLDLGCGLGACGLASARLGARVTFFDREPRAIEIVEASARAPEWRAETFEYVVGDWRMPPPLEPFDLILAADVLYDRHAGSAVAAFLVGHLRPGAEAWLADPGRVQAERFPTVARDAGLELTGTERLPSRAEQPDVGLLRLRRPLA